MSEYETTEMSFQLQKEIAEALKGLDYGSVEVFVTNGEVTQITRREIKKTNGKNKN